MVRSCVQHVQYVGELEIDCRLHGVRESIKCSGCKDFVLRAQPPYTPTDITPVTSIVSVPKPFCRYLGTKLGVAPCCGQMYACKLHKGSKCAPTGVAKDPFLSCSTCPDFTVPDSWRPNPERFDGRCVAITSLNPHPKKAERQIKCLQSWRDIGLKIIAVNTSAELQSLDQRLSHLVQQYPSQLNTSPYRKSTQKIHSMLQAGIREAIPFMLINADIEMSADSSLIEDAIQCADKLTIGIRYNYNIDAVETTAEREVAGLDMFMMAPVMAETVPDLPFSIGKPGWDYWLPQHFRSMGYDFHWIRTPFLFHERHQLAWSTDEWEIGAKLLSDHCGVKLAYDHMDFRNSLDQDKP